jgi:hypothetical protein
LPTLTKEEFVEKIKNDAAFAKEHGDRESIVKKQVLEKYKTALESGVMANTVELSDEEKLMSKDVQLLTTNWNEIKDDFNWKRSHDRMTPPLQKIWHCPRDSWFVTWNL